MRQSDARTIVAVARTGEVVGASLVYTYVSGDYVHVDEIGVLPDYQGRGIGSGMMRAIEALALDTGKRAVQLTPVAAHGFYRAQDFELYGNVGEEEARKDVL